MRAEAALVEDAGMRRIDVARGAAGPELGLAGEERLAGGAVIGEVGGFGSPTGTVRMIAAW